MELNSNNTGMITEYLDCMLVSPFYHARTGVFKIFRNTYPNIGLGYLCAFLKVKGYKAKIIDCNIEFSGYDEFEKYIENLSSHLNIRYVGFTTTTATISSALMLSGLFKKYFPDISTILGGPHVNYDFMQLVMNENIDFIIRREGEWPLFELVSGKKKSDIDGLVFKTTDHEVIANKQAKRIQDIDSLPYPDYDELRMDKYKLIQPVPVYQSPSFGIITSRGCPGNCTFCSKTIHGPLIQHSPEYIIGLIKLIVQKYHAKQIVILDDTFSDHSSFVKKLCEYLIYEKLNIVWTCQARVDSINTDLLALMKKAGCVFISYGIESLDDDVLRSVNKKISVAQIESVLEATRRAGILSRSYLMVGNLSDTEKTLLNTLHRINHLQTDFITVQPATPYPGSKMFDDAVRRKLINTTEWQEYDGYVKVMNHPTLTGKQIDHFITRFYLKFYLKTGFAIRSLKMINSFSSLKNLFTGILILAYLLFSQTIASLFSDGKQIKSGHTHKL